jgi:hypothetical protein
MLFYLEAKTCQSDTHYFKLVAAGVLPKRSTQNELHGLERQWTCGGVGLALFQVSENTKQSFHEVNCQFLEECKTALCFFFGE